MTVGGKAKVGNILIDPENDKIVVGGIEIQGVPSEGLPDSMIKNETAFIEVFIPIETNSQSVTSATPTTLTGRGHFSGGLWNMNRISQVLAFVVWESAGAGDIDLYDITTDVKIADLATPSAATSLSISSADITSWFKAQTGAKDLAIQAAGDGTNAVTVHQAYLLVRVKLG